MAEAIQRRNLIEEIYQKRQHNYCDIRRFHTVHQIKARLADIETKMKATPREARTYKKLFLERQLLRYKGMVLTKSDKLPLCTTPFQVIDATDRCWRSGVETQELAEKNKMKQICILLHYIFIARTDQELQSIIDRHK